MMLILNNLKFDNSWLESLNLALSSLDKEYIQSLNNYFPLEFLSAFSLPKDKTKYILFGQDPYPRIDSACGYSFIDARVKSIWSDKGLSKEVNRATSLRNFIKMLLSTDGFDIKNIASIDKKDYIDSIFELRDNFLLNGVLLLNIVPIFTTKNDFKYHLKEWRSFLKSLLDSIDSDVELILFGNFAKDEVLKIDSSHKKHLFEHPYNISFIENKNARELFKPMRLLERR